jgi:serine carboxypeptidase-like clade 1
VPTPVYNPWTWANASSLCEIDSPAPMGASYCTEGNGTAGSEGGPGGDAYSCGPWTDQVTACICTCTCALCMCTHHVAI